MQTFRKEERLTSKKVIDTLFEKGNSFNIFPFKIVWLDREPSGVFPAQILISVPRKKFKRAVDRNLLKRRIREAYRKNKNILYDFLERNNRSCALAVIYLPKEIKTYNEIEKKIIIALKRLISEYEKITR